MKEFTMIIKGTWNEETGDMGTSVSITGEGNMDVLQRAYVALGKNLYDMNVERRYGMTNTTQEQLENKYDEIVNEDEKPSLEDELMKDLLKTLLDDAIKTIEKVTDADTPEKMDALDIEDLRKAISAINFLEELDRVMGEED